MESGPEIVVVGAGVVGLSIALQLAERGASVTVVERAGTGAGASGVQPGGVRQQWGTRINCLLARESIGFYAEARERLRMRVDPGFRRCGYLFLAHSEAALEQMMTNVRLQTQLGIPARVVSAAEAAELAPGLDVASVAGGTWCAEDGYFDRPQSVVEALGALVDIRIDEVVAVKHGGGVRLAHGGDLDAKTVVVAAGVDTPDLLPELPIHPESRFLFFSDPVSERLLEPLVVSLERRFAAKQLGDGRLLASDLGAVGSPEADRERWRGNVKHSLEDLLPRLVHIALPTLVEGVYDMTPDGQPILGRVREGVWVSAGFSGHGFMIAPAVGRIVAEAVLEGREDEALGVLDHRRFAEGRLVPEPQAV
jgi:glycine/D-amino acid oxidase-like deaminating enzyme